MFKIKGLKTKFLLFIFILSSSAMLILGWYGYQNAKSAYQESALDLAKGYSNEITVHIKDFLQLSRNDLNFIANDYAMHRHSYWLDIGEEEKREQYHQIVANTLRGFAITYDYNYKIRLIENNGREHIKIQRDAATNNVFIAKDNELLDQSNRDFFINTMQLNKGEIFFSELNLTIENGKVVIPYIPVVRLATPLIADNKIRYGVIVVNVYAEYFFKYIQDANNNKQGRVFYLISSNGDYLYHPDTNKRFGSQLKHTASFKQDFPDLITQFATKDNGITFYNDNIITFQKIYPSNDQKYYWLLVGIVPEKFALAELENFETIFSSLAILIVLLLLISTWYFLNRLIQPLLFVNQQLQGLGRGEIKLNNIEYTGHDEIADMLQSTQQLISNMEALAKQADAVGEGDYTRQVIVLSKQDRLGIAINTMTELLKNNQQQNDDRNWQRDGLAQLSKALTGDLTSIQLANIAISLLARYINAGRGVFYQYNDKQQILELLASYMYSERHHIGNHFKLGEGAIGQVAREQKPIILGTLDLEQTQIITGTTCSIPLYTYTYPLLHENNLLGVLELANFEYLNSAKLEFLQEAVNTIAAFLYMVKQREKIKILLQVSELAEKEAIDRSEKLQKANQQMEEQQQLLQQQTEELQQANQQMEEQQQQLQQQTEELRQTNEQMERARLQVEQQNHRLIQSQQELDAKAKQLELASQYKSEFLANMSHELRTPLNSIILLSKMMAANQDQHLTQDEVHHAEIIHQAGAELLRLINDVLDLSKIEAGHLELNLTKVSSQELLTELHGLFEHLAKEKQLDFIIQDNYQAEFISDINRVSQILRNLLSNAFKFTQKGSVSLLITHTDNIAYPIKITVKDTGIGIAQEKQQLIFEAFQQGDGSISRQYGGTGLGLSISLRFAQLLGGTIELHSIIGAGSEFSLLLPNPIAIENNTVEKIKSIEDDRAYLNADDAAILLIDDDLLFAQALLEINRKLTYKTLHAATGAEGLLLAEKYHPKGILLDLVLPDMDGTSVLTQLKTQHHLADIPVYIISGREKDAALMEQGIIGYLQKPVDTKQISDAEAELLTFITQGNTQVLLVVENGTITGEQIKQLVAKEQKIQIIAVSAHDNIENLILSNRCCLAIIDLGQEISLTVSIAKILRAKNPAMNFVFLGANELSNEELAVLRPFSDSVIIKTPQSQQRLLKNIERFLIKTSNSSTIINHEAGHRLIGLHILIVDDDTKNLFVITSALEKEGAKVNGVLNGKRALEFLQQHAVDIVFMDIMMPEMDGYQTIKTIRQMPNLKDLPIVALTAKALTSDREKALAAGANDYLAKPVDYETLIHTALVWCSNRPQS